MFTNDWCYFPGLPCTMSHNDIYPYQFNPTSSVLPEPRAQAGIPPSQCPLFSHVRVVLLLSQV